MSGMIYVPPIVPPTIKSIQRGALVFNATSLAVTVAAVDVSKSILILIGYSLLAVPGDSARIALTNSTTITASKASTSGNTYCSWELVEFN